MGAAKSKETTNTQETQPVKEPWYGPKCDSTGFFQHYGECASDAIQMLILYSDGIKEVVQPYLYNTTITLEDISERIEDKNDARRIYNFLINLQKRFRRHYNTEIMKRQILQDSTINDMEKSVKIYDVETRFRASGYDGVQCQLYSFYGEENINKTEKITIREYKNMDKLGKVDTTNKRKYKFLSLLGNVLGMKNMWAYNSNFPYSISDYDRIDFSELIYNNKPLKNLVGYYIGVGSYDYRAEHIRIDKPIGHGTCFYKCGGKWYFYEDTDGPFPFYFDIFLTIDTYPGLKSRIDKTLKPLVIPDVIANNVSQAMRRENSHTETRKKINRISILLHYGISYRNIINSDITYLIDVVQRPLIIQTTNKNIKKNILYSYYPYIRINFDTGYEYFSVLPDSDTMIHFDNINSSITINGITYFCNENYKGEDMEEKYIYSAIPFTTSYKEETIMNINHVYRRSDLRLLPVKIIQGGRRKTRKRKSNR